MSEIQGEGDIQILQVNNQRCWVFIIQSISQIKINYALFFKHFILIYVHVYVLRKKEECVHFCRGDRKSEIHIC